MLKLHKIKALPILLIVALLAGSIYVGSVKAATVVDMVTTSSNQNAAALTTLTSSWTTLDAIAAGDVITMTYGASSAEFDLSTVTILSDITLTDSTTGALSTAADCTGAELFSATLSGQDVVLTACTEYAGLALGGTVTVALANVTNGASTNSPHAVSFAGTAYTDDGSSNVPVIDPGTVTVTATVDPTISFHIYETTTTTPTSTCALGTLDLGGNNAVCEYDIVGATNATSGMTISWYADVATLTSGTDTIAASSASVTPGLTDIVGEGYGIYHEAYSPTSPGLLNNAQMGDTDAVSTISANFASVPVGSGSSVVIFDSAGAANESRINIVHQAEISATTAAGSYSQVVTYTAVGTF